MKQAQQAFGADIIECKVGDISDELVEVCKSLGIKIMAYASSNTEEEFHQVIASKADMVNLDRPLRYYRCLKSLSPNN